MRAAGPDLDILIERANQAAAGLTDFRSRIRSQGLRPADAMEASAGLAGLRVAAAFPIRLTRVDLSYHALELGDLIRSLPPPAGREEWMERLSLTRQLMWHQLAAGEVRAARLASSAILNSLGHEFIRIREVLDSEEFHLTAVIESLAEFAYVGGPRMVFELLGAETVYDRSPSGGAQVYTFRGSALTRPAYQRLPVAGELEKFRKYVLDELSVHGREMASRSADPRKSVPFRTCGLIVLGYHLNLRLRSDHIPPPAQPYISLVSHLLS